MDDTLRMNVNGDLFGRDIEEPPRLYDLEALVHKGGRIDGYLPAHGPPRVPKGLPGGDAFQPVCGEVEEGPSRGGQNYALYVLAPVAREGLEDGAVLAVHGKEPRPAPSRLFHYEGPGHDEGFLVGQGDVLAGPYGLKGGHKPGGAGYGRDDGVGLLDGGGPYGPLAPETHLHRRALEFVSKP